MSLNPITIKASRHKHHSSNKAADCTSFLYRRIFPDSEIALRYSSALAKTEAIITSIIAPPAIENSAVVKNITVSYCGVATGASNYKLQVFSCCNPVF